MHCYLSNRNGFMEALLVEQSEAWRWKYRSFWGTVKIVLFLEANWFSFSDILFDTWACIRRISMRFLVSVVIFVLSLYFFIHPLASAFISLWWWQRSHSALSFQWLLFVYLFRDLFIFSMWAGPLVVVLCFIGNRGNLRNQISVLRTFFVSSCSRKRPIF